MKKVFMHYRGELPVKIEFRPNYILISSKSRRAKKWADKLIKKEAKKSDIIHKKKKGRYYPKDLSNYIENSDNLYNNLLEYWWINESETLSN